MKPAVHDPRHDDGTRLSTSEIYNLSQTCTCDCTTSGYPVEEIIFENGYHSIRDGDVLLCEWRGRLIHVIMVEAWPVAMGLLDVEDGMYAYELGDEVGFHVHRLDTDEDWATLDGGKYLPSVEVASQVTA